MAVPVACCRALFAVLLPTKLYMPGFWLHFGDNYSKTSTKHVQFDQLVPGEDVSVLEGLRELTLRRDQSCGAESLKQHQATLEDQAQWCGAGATYLGLDLFWYWPATEASVYAFSL